MYSSENMQSNELRRSLNFKSRINLSTSSSVYFISTFAFHQFSRSMRRLPGWLKDQMARRLKWSTRLEFSTLILILSQLTIW